MALDDLGGVIDLLRNLNESNHVLFTAIPAFSSSVSTGVVEIAYQWTMGIDEEIQSLVNGSAAVAGGVHEEGFKRAITEVINRFASLPMAGQLLGSDVREGLTAVISVTIEQPRFGSRGQLAGEEIRQTVVRTTSHEVGRWLDGHNDEANLIVKKALAARANRIEDRTVFDRKRRGDL